MKRLAFLLILGTCIGIFNLHAQWETPVSFGLSGNIMRQEGNFSNGLQSTTENQSRLMFFLGFYVDSYFLLKNLPVGFFGSVSTHFTTKMDYNGKTVDIFGMPLQILAGPVFYFDVSERIRIVSGIGFHWSFLFITAAGSWTKELVNNSTLPEYSIWEFRDGMGIGGKVNIDFKMNESVDFEIGSSFAYDFYSSYKNYQAIYITPHIGMSLRN
ncbi:MAG: hypothetical protein LBF77_11120 [Spirochaetaceae bacterium]|jgi:hypothetical protein|nr:hypothetical protein [Spirochaetaceae bacterium]